MSLNIYQQLWDIDLANNGCTVSGKDKDGSWVLPDADILVDEQLEVTGDTDAAPDLLFQHVNPEKLSAPTYTTFVALLNNYVINARLSEDHLGDNEVEDAEISDFLNAIIDTDVMRNAADFIRKELVPDFDEPSLRAALLKMWFELYTNHFNNIPTAYVSGFEHVMVGEGKVKGDGIGGYHSWIKFFLDEQSGRVDFRGFNYDGNFNRSSKASANFPYVATVAMRWKQVDIHGNDVGELRKDLGGFFIGPSPELQLALGTVAMFESIAGRYKNSVTGIKNDRKPVTLMNGKFHLVMYRNTTKEQERGDRVRSFWPKFISPATSSDVDVVVPVGSHEGDQNNGAVQIVRALVNPEGSDIGREWVEIENSSDAIIDLQGWALADKQARRQALLGQIEPGKTRRIVVSRQDPSFPQLGNKGGLLVIRNAANEVAACVGYDSAGEGTVLHFIDQ